MSTMVNENTIFASDLFHNKFHSTLSQSKSQKFTLSLDTGSLHTSKDLPQGRPSLNWDKYLQQPTFDESNVQKVVAAEGSTAFLHCKINHLADRAVSNYFTFNETL